jgi:hypothetical protein
MPRVPPLSCLLSREFSCVGEMRHSYTDDIFSSVSFSTPIDLFLSLLFNKFHNEQPLGQANDEQ